MLRGPNGTHREVLDRYAPVASMLGSIGASVTRFEHTPRGGWRIVLDGGTEFVLGAGDPEPVLRRYVVAIGRLFGPGLRGVGLIDLRYVNGFAVRMRESASEQGEG